MAMKLHIIFSTLKDMFEFIDKAKKDPKMAQETNEQLLTRFIRSLLGAEV